MAKRSGTVAKGSEVALRPVSELATPLTPEWQKRLEQYAEQAQAVTAGGSGWPFIGTRSGVFRINDELYDSPLQVILLGAVNENTYYDGVYDPDSTQRPACFAVGKVGAGDSELAPPEDLETRQSDRCEPCAMNQFGTAERGKGKACKNSLRVAMLPADNLDPAVLRDIEGARLRIPPTSIKNFGKYRDLLVKGYKLPLFAAVTAVHIRPHDKKQFEITFEPAGAIRDPEVLEALLARLDEATRELESLPPRKTEEEEAPAQAKPEARAPRGAGRKATRGIPADEATLPELPEAGKGFGSKGRAAAPAATTTAAQGDKPRPRTPKY